MKKLLLVRSTWMIACHVILQAILINCNAQMDTTVAPAKKWHFLVEPYLMFANLNGTVGMGELPDADVNEDFSDIFNHLQAGVMVYAEMHNNHWAITSDLSYMKLGEDCI